MTGKIKEAYDVLDMTNKCNKIALRDGMYGPHVKERLEGIIKGIEVAMNVLKPLIPEGVNEWGNGLTTEGSFRAEGSVGRKDRRV